MFDKKRKTLKLKSKNDRFICLNGFVIFHKIMKNE